MKKSSYYLGVLIGMFFSALIVLYALYDGYRNYKSGNSIAVDIALLFAFFAWQKTNQLFYSVKDFMLSFIYNSLGDEKKEG